MQVYLFVRRQKIESENTFRSFFTVLLERHDFEYDGAFDACP